MEEEADEARTNGNIRTYGNIPLEFVNAPPLPVVAGGGRCLIERRAFNRFYYKCQQCQKQFSNRIALKNHSSFYHAEYPFECQYCNNRFKCEGHLRVHTLVPSPDGMRNVGSGRPLQFQWDFKFRNRPDYDFVLLEQKLDWDTIVDGIQILVVQIDKLPDSMRHYLYLVLFRTLYFMRTTQYSSSHLPKYDKGRFDKYRKTLKNYLSTVLPEDVMLSLENYFLLVKEFPEPQHKEIFLARYRELVYPLLKSGVMKGFKYMVTQDREGYLVDRALLKEIIFISVEINIEIEQENFSKNRFKVAYLRTSTLYYRRAASHWKFSSLSSYILKVSDFFKREKDLASFYRRAENGVFMYLEKDVCILLERLAHILFNSKVIEFDASKRSVFELLLRNDTLRKSYFESDKVADMIKTYQVFQNFQNVRGSRALEITNLFKKGLLDRIMKISIFDSMEDKDRVPDLTMAYQFLSELPESGDLKLLWANLFEEHIMSKATILFEDVVEAEKSTREDRKDLRDEAIESFIRFSANSLLCWVACCRSDPLFKKSYYRVFLIFFNKSLGANCSFAKIVAGFLNNCALKAVKASIEKQSVIEDIIDKVLRVYHMMKDMHYFMAYYRQCFNTRLFHKRVNIEVERKIWEIFKGLEDLGNIDDMNMRMNLELMVNDMSSPMNRARKDQAPFEEFCSMTPDAGTSVKFTVNLIRKTCWPAYHELSSLELPPDMVQCVDLFESFNKTLDQPPRKLVWICSPGSCTLKVNGVKLVMDVYQAIVLQLFKEVDVMTFDEISSKCKHLAEGDMKRLMRTLCGPYQILKKRPEGKRVAVTDSFEFNSEFTHHESFVKLPLRIQVFDKKVFGNTPHLGSALCCTILETMRARKVMNEKDLQNECVKQSGCSLKVLKDRFSDMIDEFIRAGYLARDFGPEYVRGVHDFSGGWDYSIQYLP